MTALQDWINQLVSDKKSDRVTIVTGDFDTVKAAIEEIQAAIGPLSSLTQWTAELNRNNFAVYVTPVVGNFTTVISALNQIIAATSTSAAISAWVSQLTNYRASAFVEPLLGSFDVVIAALQDIQTGISGYIAHAVNIFVPSNSAGVIASYENSAATFVDSRTVLFSAWLRNPLGGTGKRIWSVATSETGFWVFSFYRDHIEVDLFAANGTDHYLIRVNTWPDDILWHNIIIAMDTNHAAHAKVSTCSIDGAAQVVLEGSDTSGAFSVAWSIEPAYIGYEPGWADAAGDQADVADLWLGMGQYADATDAAVIAKFRNPITGKPVYLGANGELPTGTSPTIFFSGTAATFGQPNLGTGGAFVKSTALGGTITDAATHP